MDAGLQKLICDALLGEPLVTNAFRGTLVEAMLAQVLGPEWRWCSADWASHDFEHADGARLEVKQSAALQSWHEPGGRPNRGKFDIRARTGRYEGSRWFAEPGRTADIYIFAWHPVFDPKIADHRIADQWRVYAVREAELPQQKTIALSRIEALVEALSIDEVANAVDELRGG